MSISRIKFLNLFAFEESLLLDMREGHLQSLFISYLYTFIFSCLMFALSGASVVLMVPEISWYRYLISLFVFIVIFIFMFNLERLFLTQGFYPIEQPLQEIKDWRPNELQKRCIQILSIFFAIPILMFLNRQLIDISIGEYAKNKGHVFEATELQKSADIENNLLQRSTSIAERIERINLSLTQLDAFNTLLSSPPNQSPKKKPEVDTSKEQKKPTSTDHHRKALVIGMENYKNYNNLSNTPWSLNDADAVAKKLSEMGFEVTKSKDETYNQLKTKINNYVKSLDSKDMSVVYYAGHGFQTRDHNYILPLDVKYGAVDSSDEDAVKARDSIVINSSIDVMGLLKAISKNNPRLNLIILDACRQKVGEELGGLAPFEMDSQIANNIIFSATSPGLLSSADDTLEHGIFTFALLKYLSQDDTIFNIMPRVSKDTASLSNDYIKRRKFCQTSDGVSHPACKMQQPDVRFNATDSSITLLAPGIKKIALNEVKNKKDINNPPPIAKEPSPEKENPIVPVANQVCSKYEKLSLTASQTLLLNCLNAELLAVNKELDQIKHFQSFGVGALKKWYTQQLTNTTMVKERLDAMLFSKDYIGENSQYSKYTGFKRFVSLVLNVFFALVIFRLLISGIVSRYSRPTLEARRAYESLRYEQSRKAIIENFDKTNLLADQLLSTHEVYKSDKFPKYYPWDDRKNFYKEFKPQVPKMSGKELMTPEDYHEFISSLEWGTS